MSFEHIKKNLIVPNKIEDVFIHSWHNEEDVGKPYNSTQASQNGSVGLVRAKTKEMLVHFYKPKLSIIEPQRDFGEYKDLVSAPTANQEVLASQFYSTHMANSLKKQYEESNNFKYDLVIRTRFDLFYNGVVDLSKFEEVVREGKIVVMKKFQDDQEKFQNPDKPMTDIFVFGNSEKMDIFCSVFQNMRRLNALVSNPFSENYHGRFVRIENDVDISTGDFDFNLLQRMVKLS